MILRISKNYRKIAYLVLISYLALFIAEVSHHHFIQLNSESSFKVSNDYKANNHYTLYSEFTCPIHQFFNFLHNYKVENSQSTLISVKIESISFDSDNLTPKFFNKSQPFRAPPIVFS